MKTSNWKIIEEQSKRSNNEEKRKKHINVTFFIYCITSFYIVNHAKKKNSFIYLPMHNNTSSLAISTSSSPCNLTKRQCKINSYLNQKSILFIIYQNKALPFIHLEWWIVINISFYDDEEKTCFLSGENGLDEAACT